MKAFAVCKAQTGLCYSGFSIDQEKDEAEKDNAECSNTNLAERLRVSESTVSELHKSIEYLGKADQETF